MMDTTARAMFCRNTRLVRSATENNSGNCEIPPSSLVRKRTSAARAAARLISKTGRPKYETNAYSILSEPSELERASGIYTLSGMIPTGDVVEQARALGRDREQEVLRLESRG